MNLDFGILWIEDEFAAEEEALLKRQVLEAGFIARIENIPNGEELEALAERNHFFHRYDLILLDFRLQNAFGDELAPKVRELFPATNILFYSSAANEDELRKKIAVKRVEGVYCSHRDRFINRAGQLINQFSSSLNRLSGMRGLSMRVVAECDEILAHAVKFMTEYDEGFAAALTNLDKDVLSHMDKMIEDYKAVMSGSLDDRLKTRAVDSNKRFNLFRRQSKTLTESAEVFGLSNEQADRLRELRRSTARYREKVLDVRNALGHAIEEETEHGWILRGSNDIQVDGFPTIRKAFASHIDDFSEMRDIICTLGAKQLE